MRGYLNGTTSQEANRSGFDLSSAERFRDAIRRKLYSYRTVCPELAEGSNPTSTGSSAISSSTTSDTQPRWVLSKSKFS